MTLEVAPERAAQVHRLAAEVPGGVVAATADGVQRVRAGWATWAWPHLKAPDGDCGQPGCAFGAGSSQAA